MTIDLSLRWQVIEGDCLDVMRGLPDGCVDAVVTDPPYGIGIANNRFVGGVGVGRPTERVKSTWDDKPLSPEQWAECVRLSRVRLAWGFNHIAHVVGPCSHALVWDKKCKNGWDDDFADCEIAYCSTSGPAKMHRYLWMGAMRVRAEIDGERVHPTQKPVDVMRWSIRHCALPPDSLILDPFTGSGSIGIAATQEGHRFIGIEREPAYAAIARQRIADAAAQGNLFDKVTS